MTSCKNDFLCTLVFFIILKIVAFNLSVTINSCKHLKHIIITFSFRFYDMFFVYNIIETSCFFVLEEKNNRSILSAIGAYWNPWAPLSFKNLPPSPQPYYSSLINDRLYKSITTVKLHLDWSSMVYSCVGSADLFFILGCISSNLHCCT